VNRPMHAKELEQIKTSLERDRPLGSERWISQTVGQLGLEHTIRKEGRPRLTE
jgi:hypothetical protein